MKRDTRDTPGIAPREPAGRSTDRLETELADLERAIGRLRALQAERLRQIDLRQVPAADGCRTLSDWIVSRLDVAPETARLLSRVARSDAPAIDRALAEGTVTFDRAVELHRLGGADPIAESAGWDVPGLRRRVAARRRYSRMDERHAHAERHLVFQPSLDSTRTRVWGMLPGVGGNMVAEVLETRADTFGPLPDGSREPRSARMADALVALCLDSNDHRDEAKAGSSPMVTVFVDAREAAATNGETGVTLQAGPRVGPQALEAVLCEGTVEVVALAADGEVLGVGDRSHVIPPRVRRHVLFRDGACAADGCSSRYRLQPHHITPRAAGADHDPANLTTLCWFHHHVVIHGHGYRIDPDSLPQRRRFLEPNGTDPP